MRFALIGIALTLGTAGCGSQRVIPVSGIVKINHEPASGVLVFFWPDSSTKETFGYRHAVGISDDKGHYYLKCSRDGLLGVEEGQYHVTFSKPVDPPSPPKAEPGKDKDEREEKHRPSRRVESIPLPYSDHAHPKNSPSLVTVSRTGDRFDFDLPGS
jgi:hypothetical protein